MNRREEKKTTQKQKREGKEKKHTLEPSKKENEGKKGIALDIIFNILFS